MSNPPDTSLVFLLGTLGALAPEIVRLHALLRSGRAPRFRWGYWLISTVYAALGGVLAVILPAVNLYAAFYAGVTLPVTISAMLRPRRNAAPAPDKQPAPFARDAWALFQAHAEGLF